jgi:transposase-like protein
LKTKYSPEFREQAVQKTLNRGSQTIEEIADKLSVNSYTLKHWLREYHPKPMPHKPDAKSPADWTNEEKLHALMASYGLKDEALASFCRQQGLFIHHLSRWKTDFTDKQSSPPNQPKSDKALRDEIIQLNKELSRKDKALAEAAALLILQKKFQAFWAEKES